MSLDDRIKDYQDEVAPFRVEDFQGDAWPSTWALIDDLIADREKLKKIITMADKTLSFIALSPIRGGPVVSETQEAIDNFYLGIGILLNE